MVLRRKKKIGELLCEKAYLDNANLETALAEQKTAYRRLGQIVMDLGYVTQHQLNETLALQAGISRVDLNDISINKEIISLVPAELVSKYNILPLRLERRFTGAAAANNGNSQLLAVAMTDPFQMQVIEDLRFVTGYSVRRYYADPKELEDAILKFYGSNVARMMDNLAPEEQRAEAEEELANGEFSPAKLQEMAREPSLVNLVNLIILEAIDARASDIHIEPFEHEVKIKYRIDGILQERTPSSKRLRAAITSRIKIMADMNIAERFVPQDGHIEFTGRKGRVDIRVSTVPTVYGESVVLRLLDKTASLLELEELGMDSVSLEGFSHLLRKTHGIVLVTGPTGCGKTTTLYAALQKIYTPAVKMITIEDPVEYQLDGINQMPVNPKRGLTFATGLRHILRHDPDIVMVGEIRDTETANIAIRAALTGHLVFSTLHTNDAPGAITRLIDMGVEPFLLASSLEGILAQRLVRKICPKCKESYIPDESLLKSLNGSVQVTPETRFYHGKGCHECGKTGMAGRKGIFELLRMTTKLRDLITQKASTDQIIRAAPEDHVSMMNSGMKLVLQGVTTPEEVLRVAKSISEDDE
ncbi:MAG: Flp pilus assembly complex ATPase component TadA [Sedimentisphaerales bacterium]|nr:Flp pilus assembly complex ATPase component TadA [Sedimentisphaerales bacterium]